MNNQTEYYLESLITEAFKGKGFQKISDLFAEKASCSSQRHSKAMLTQLDRLINKELDRNEFRHVTLLMKCIQHFCKNDSHEAFSLIHQGLISKMVIWFERTLEFLKICDEDNTFISELVEEIYDTVVVICRSDNKEGVKQLVDSFLFTLGLVITENWPAFHIRLEAIKTFNLILDHIALEEKKSLQASEDMGALMKTMARNLFDVGDYDVQVAISEALCRMTPRKLRENLAQLWFEDDFFAQAFLQVNDKDFETDCRNFLNCLNSRGRDGQRVYTFPCIDVFADSEKLRKPQDSKLEHFWIDFNVGSQCVSFYIQNHEGLLWDSVRLQKGLVAAYSLQDVDGQTLLNLHSRNFFLINRKEAKLVRIYFESKHNVEHAVIKTYGEELKMTVIGQDGSIETSTQAISSPSTGTTAESTLWQKSQSSLHRAEGTSLEARSAQTEEKSPPSETSFMSNKEDQVLLKENLKDNKDAVLPAGEKMPAVICRDVRVVLSPVRTKDIMAKGYSPKKQNAEKTPFNYEYPESTPSGTDIELMQVDSIKSPGSSTKRGKPACPPRRPVTRASLSETKKPVSHRALCSSESGVDSGKSWVLESKKPTPMSADYSRKKSKPRSRLRVLPLSSESSDENVNHNKDNTFTSVKKKNTHGKGRAESLCFPDVPGVSGLLTPGSSMQHKSGTITVSDLDQDIMDPLQEMSSPEGAPLIKSLQKEDFQSGFCSKVAPKEAENDYTVDLQKKRKRTLSGEEELVFKPRKLFGSCDKVADALKEVPQSQSPDSNAAESNFISSFEKFSEDLKNKMMSTYKKMEIQAQDMLTAAQTHMSSLISQIQKCKLHKLQHFCEIVARELATLEADSQTLTDMEKETMEIWEAQTKKIQEFCVNQTQRLEARVGEAQSIVAKNDEEITKVNENSKKLLKD